MTHIKAADSIDTPTGDAFIFLTAGSDNFVVDADAFLLSQSGGNGAKLIGSWTVTINGEVGSFGAAWHGLEINANSPTDVSNVTVGRTGEVFGDGAGIAFFEAAGGTITNLGTISSAQQGLFWTGTSAGHLTINNSGLIEGGNVGVNLGSGTITILNTGTIRGAGVDTILSLGETHLTNSGKIDGTVALGNENDIFTDFKKIGHVIESGTVSGLINLGGGDDHFNGGNNNEKVKDGDGSDVYKLGGGDDTYISGVNGGANDADTVDGGSGIDTYNASAAVASVTVTLSPQFASGADIGFDDITGFENAIGGSGDDFLFGNSAANTLSGGNGGDHLAGFGGRDILTGGADLRIDFFVFTKLSDSGTKASTRDVITDFDVIRDFIDLQAIDANTKASGDQAFSFIGRANFNHAAGQVRESFSGGNTIVSGDVNGDGKADFSILLKGHVLMVDVDFLL